MAKFWNRDFVISLAIFILMTPERRYAGTVTRSRLVASLIIDVSNELVAKQ